MSRSYKKRPYCTDGRSNTTKESKRFANKTVRQYKKEIKNGKMYKHLYCSYDIHDYISRWTWEDAKNTYLKDNSRYPWKKYYNFKEFYKMWNKYYRREVNYYEF